MVSLKPCILERRFLPKVWGGRALVSALGIDLPTDEAIGETWEVYDRPEGSSVVRGGSATLHDLMVADAPGLLGRGVRPTADGRFPLLVKYIDARDALSVQVHPATKTEAWFVLAAGPAARIVCGLRPGVTAAEFAAVAHTAEVEGLLHAFAPAAGDAVYVPAGTVHAIGPDVVVYEIQQNADVTFRLYDWGRPRETHVAEALGALRVDSGAEIRRHAGRDDAWLFRNEFFTTRRMSISSPGSLGTEGTFKVLSVVEGQGTLGWHSGGEEPPLMLRCGDTALIPATIGVAFLSPIGRMTLLVSGPGEA